MKKFTRNSYFNPAGTGVLLTKNGKLALSEQPVRMFWTCEDGGDPDPSFAISVDTPSMLPGAYTYFRNLRSKLNAPDPHCLFTSKFLDHYIAPWGVRHHIRAEFELPAGQTISRSMIFWIFGKKISMDVTERGGQLALMAVDTEGRVTVNGEDRGIWPRIW